MSVKTIIKSDKTTNALAILGYIVLVVFILDVLLGTSFISSLLV